MFNDYLKRDTVKAIKLTDDNVQAFMNAFNKGKSLDTAFYPQPEMAVTNGTDVFVIGEKRRLHLRLGHWIVISNNLSEVVGVYNDDQFRIRFVAVDPFSIAA